MRLSGDVRLIEDENLALPTNRTSERLSDSSEPS